MQDDRSPSSKSAFRTAWFLHLEDRANIRRRWIGQSYWNLFHSGLKHRFSNNHSVQKVVPLFLLWQALNIRGPAHHRPRICRAAFVEQHQPSAIRDIRRWAVQVRAWWTDMLPALQLIVTDFSIWKSGSAWATCLISRKQQIHRRYDYITVTFHVTY